MNIRSLILAGLAAGCLATVAVAEEAQPAEAPKASGKESEVRLGEKEYKERINLVARKPHRHDIGWIDSRDRETWRDFTSWQGVRDERPMIARKTLGYHQPRPHATRAERVERVSRGPLRGPAPSE